MTSLSDLKQIGAFVPGAPVQKEIKWKFDPEGEELTATIFVKRMSIGEQERIFMRANGQSQESRSARMISELVTLGDGNEAITFTDAFSLDPALGSAMIEAIGEVNKQLTAKK